MAAKLKWILKKRYLVTSLFNEEDEKNRRQRKSQKELARRIFPERARSSPPEVFLGIGVLKYAVNLQENTHVEV